MRFLIVEDDFTSRKFLQNMLAPFGECDIAVNGVEAVEAFKTALDSSVPYDLVCLDIMMPEMDGHEALRAMRSIERERDVAPAQEVPVVMTTALDDPKNVVEAYYKGGATSYVPKPIDRQLFLQLLRNLGVLH
ncbi:response regulator [Nitratidesulfovibrio vulgaris]|jgi:two-component system chemotaxis response regulator CheY|uniref:Response regulator n=2 Tax=Nitratidesulfovibrio vulgaris TaxID=881 RepID=Q727T4_NITV2|nr:response regulator [Nitratidesulfovibrio vulgaris]GEB79625.1 two-component system response regulator [Desulfovibrio desulfuricans]HBW16240.1 response regulator [Desulfovibrio sp.]AAS97242.1 response regulator [Nitratidesulfovibrio vulgaris str. Hildenborough]ABM27562.1 response regulator receiver protein [Nitratidesulfovibrio vulgaris DP4]ADP87702.1 response regulator receiver protein [Nitratidesulfovibrio vulgaris RCH1]